MKVYRTAEITESFFHSRRKLSSNDLLLSEDFPQIVSVDNLVAIARIAKPRGIRGEVTADVLTDFPERFENLKTVTAILPESGTLELTIEKYRFHQQRILFSFENVGSIEEAEKLRGAEICVPESEAVKLEDDEYYDWELTDCTVETVEGEKIGTVRELMRTGGTEILVVEGAEKEFLIPFAESICQEVDIENKLIRVDVPDGLLDF